jgi:hypothetical protein
LSAECSWKGLPEHRRQFVPVDRLGRETVHLCLVAGLLILFAGMWGKVLGLLSLAMRTSLVGIGIAGVILPQ